MSDDGSRPLDVGDVETMTAALHKLAFAPQPTNSAGTALPQLTDAPRLAAPGPKTETPQVRPSMPERPYIPTWSEAQKLAGGGRGIGGKVVKFVVLAAIIGGGFLGVRALMSGEDGGAKVVTVTTTPLLGTTGVSEAETDDGYQIPELNGVLSATSMNARSIDSVFNGQPWVGTVDGGGTNVPWSAQFEVGPPEVLGLEFANGGDQYWSRPVGTEDYTCDPSVWRPAFLDPFFVQGLLNLAHFVALPTPFATATYVGDEDLNGKVRTRYDISVDGAAFNAADPTGYTAWATVLQIDVVGTVHLQLWTDAEQMVWKYNISTDGSTNRQSVTAIEA